ncbi:non-ribosomal peptide synthetase, partial [Zooshikella harenae]
MKLIWDHLSSQGTVCHMERDNALLLGGFTRNYCYELYGKLCIDSFFLATEKVFQLIDSSYTYESNQRVIHDIAPVKLETLDLSEDKNPLISTDKFIEDNINKEVNTEDSLCVYIIKVDTDCYRLLFQGNAMLFSDEACVCYIKSVFDFYGKYLHEEKIDEGNYSINLGLDHSYKKFYNWLNTRDASKESLNDGGLYHSNVIPQFLHYKSFSNDKKINALCMALSSDTYKKIQRVMGTLSLDIQQLTVLALAIYLYKISGKQFNTIGVHKSNLQNLLTTNGIYENNEEVVPYTLDITHTDNIRTLVAKIANPKIDGIRGKYAHFDTIIFETSELTSYVSQSLNVDLVGKSILNGELPLQLQWNLTNDKQRAVLNICYRSDVFNRTEAELFSERILNIATSMSEDVEQPISKVNLVTEKELALLAQWNNGSKCTDDSTINEKQTLSIHQLFEKQVKRTPQAIAVADDSQQVTYNELNQLSNQLAQYFAQKGVKPGDCVGICLDRSVSYVAAILGILKTGAAYVPLDLTYPADRLVYMIEDCQASFVITENAQWQPLNLSEQLTANVIFFNEALQQRDSLSVDNMSEESRASEASVDCSSDGLAYVIYTSGSTGKPKGVAVSHKNLVSSILARQSFYQHPISAHLLISSFSFDCTVAGIFWTLLDGGKLFIAQYVYDLSYLVDTIEQQQISHLLVLPSLYRQLLEEAEVNQLRSLQVSIVGGESFGYDLKKLHFSKINSRLFNEYGPTEGTVWSSSAELINDNNAVITIGRIAPHINGYVCLPDYQLCPIGVAGELLIGGAGVAKGYINNELLTKAKFIKKPTELEHIVDDPILYRTGDLVKWLPNGELEFIGRVDDQVKIRGYRVELGEIDNTLRKHQKVAEAVTIITESAYHENAQKHLVSYIIAVDKQAYASVEQKKRLTDEAIDYLKQILPAYMVPSKVVVLDTFPLTANGKIDKKSLPTPEFRILPVDMDVDYIASQTGTEEKVVSLVQQVLGINTPISTAENFFKIGGNSLLAMKLLSLINKTIGVKLSIKEIFFANDLRSLAENIDKSSVDKSVKQNWDDSIQPVDTLMPVPLSYSQQQLWAIDQLEGGSSHYHLPLVLQLNGKLSESSLVNALTTIVERHQSLRTVFVNDNGQAYQKVLPLPVEFKLPVTDLRGIEKNKQQAIFEVQQQASTAEFNLQQDLMLRGHLILLDESQAQLLLTMHHIAADGWSYGILINELNKLYNSFYLNQTPTLPKLPIQYADYAHWQRQKLNDRNTVQSQINYWKKQLAGMPELHSLPLDKPRPSQQHYRGSISTFNVSKELTESLHQCCEQQGATLFMGLFALFSALLSRYSHETDITMGTPTANRESSDVSELIGFFVNTVVLRADLASDPSFNELILQCRNTSLDAFANQHVPFELLVDELKPTRSLSHHPIFQVMLVLQNNRQAQYQLTDLNVTPLKLETRRAKFDLTLNIEEHVDGLTLDWEYNTDLFEAATIGRLASHFNQLLTAVLASPTLPITQLSLLTEQEQQQLLHDWNPPSLDLPVKTIAQQFALQVQAAPTAVAAVMNDDVLSYQQLEVLANQLAHYLIAQGVPPCSLVGVCLPRSLNMVVATLAVLKADCAYVPLDPQYPEERLSYLLSDSQVSWVLTESGLETQLPLTDQQPVLLDSPELQSTLATYPTTAPVVSVDEHSPVYVIYTSGSTGQPKGGVVPHRGILRLVLNNPEVPVDQSTVMLQSASVTFDAATLELWGPLLNGGQVVLYPEEVVAPAQLASCINQHQVNTIWLTSGLFDQWVAAELPAMPSLRYVLTGGDVVSPLSVARCYQQYPHVTVINGYGPTENTTFTCCFPIPKDWPVDQPLPIGKPIGNTQVYVLDAHQQPVPIGVVGELYAGGDGVALAYLNNPALTAEKFIADSFSGKAQRSDKSHARLYRTGDLVKWCADGTLAFMGRTDNQVKVRGFRIELGEVENALLSQADVAEALVVVKTTDTGSKRLVAYVVPADSASLTDQTTSAQQASALRDSLKQQLPNYMVPSAIILLASFPLTSNGKVDRKALPEPQYESQQGYIAPTTTEETVLCEIWQQVLGVNSVGINDNFFAIGGDSILAIQVASRTLRAGYQLSTRQVFEYQTIAELAKQIKQRESEQIQDQYVVGDQPLLPIQHAFFNDNDIDQHYFNQALRIKLPKGVTDEQLKKVLIAVYKRHDVFRLGFKKQENNWLGQYGESSENNKAYLTVQEKGDDFEHLIDLAHRSFDLSQTSFQANLSHVVLSLESELGREMVWIIHHLIVDGVSWRILLQDLSLALSQLQQGKSVNLGGKTSSYQAWGTWLQQYSQSEVLLAERDYWLDVVQSSVPRVKTDQLISIEDNSRENSRTVTAKLNTEISQALLQSANRCYHTQINDLLLTALLLTVTEWQNSQAIRIELEGHGREAINDEFDLNETVGWFTTIFPVVLQRTEGEIDAQIKAVKEYLRAIPNKGLGYGVLRQLSRDNDLNTTEAVDIVFNYLGQFDGDEPDTEDYNAASVLTSSFEKTGNWVSLKRQRSHRLCISGLVSNGQLQLEWDYNQLEYHASTIKLLADNYLKHLTAIVEHCLDAPGAYTLSDFSLSQISPQQLNQLQADYPTIEDLYPCTPMQQGMLFHSQMQPESGVYITQLILSFGAIDREHFQRSWQQLVERHAILRTAFVHLDQRNPLQLVQSQVELPWQTRDWRTLSAEAYQEQWYSLLEAERADFNLGQVPLMRLMLVQEADDRHHLIWTHHHALLDGWGVPVLFKDLEAFYCANVQGTTVTQSPVAPYRRYIQWLQLQSEQAAKTYWQDYLKGFTEPTLLSDPQYQRHEPKQSTFVEEHLLTLDSVITEQLQQVARHAKVTLSTVFQGAWGILLNRYCGSNDVVFGVTRSGRPEEVVGVEEMVGLFINSVPLRLQIPSDEQLISQWLQTIHQSQTALDQYGYASLVDIQRWSEVETGQKLFNSLVVFENYPIEERWRDGEVDNATHAFSFKGISAIEQTNFPITVAIIPGKQIQIKVLFNSVELSKAFIEHLTVSFTILLESLTKDINQCVNDLSLLSTETKNKVLYQWNDTFRQYPADTSIAELFEKQVADNNNKVAIILGEEQLTYDELNAKANQLAHYLIEQGTTVGDLVGIYLNRSIDVIISMLAILKAGAAYVPLDPQYPAERLAYMLADTDLNLIISHTSLVSQLPLNQQVTICLNDFALQTELAKLSSDSIISLDNLSESPLAYVMYTSGSTGQPKGVKATQKGVVRLAINNSSLPLSPDTVMLQCASVTFDAATFEVWGALLNGGQLILYKEPLIDPLTLATTINEFNINTLWLTAGLFDQFVANCSHPLPSLQYLLTGGDVVNPVSVAEFYKRHPQLTIINGYGPTENVTFTCCYKIPRNWPTHQPIPIGKPISNTTVYVLDEQLNPVSVGVTGELYTGGDGVASGYLNQDALTASRFIPNPFSKNKNTRLYRTGDLVRWLPDGNIAFVGRADQQVKLRGFRIELGEIESALSHCAEVSESVVLIYNSSQHYTNQHQQDKRIVAYVVLTHSVESSNTEITTTLQVKLAEQLPGYMVPSTIMIVPEIPLTANGKVDRRALPEPDIISETYVAPSTLTEMALAEIWKVILDSAYSISREASFFELGGHSLLAMQLVAAIRGKFVIDIAIHRVFEQAVLSEQAKLIDQLIAQQKTCLPEIQPNNRQDLSQLSYAQQRLWFIDQMEGGSAHYNMPLAFRLKGDVNLEALNKALATIIERHEVLRTSFINKSGEVYQQVEAMPKSWQLPLKDLQGVDKQTQEKMLTALQQEEADKPFNLSTDLLLRGLLIKVDTTDVVLLLTMHHIASDGWSLGILMDEISQLYHRINNNNAANLPELSIQYCDYARWQRSPQVSQLLDTQLSFWKKQLANLPAVHNLPLDKPRPATQQYHGRWHYLQLNNQVTNQFKQLCQQQGVTLFMGLHAAFSVLLARYSGDSDIVVGTPIANREQQHLAELIGFFVNTLVLRSDLDDNPSYLQLLEQTKTTALDAYAHLQVPFEQLVEVLQPARDLSYHPLFQVMLVLNSRQQTMQLEDISCTPMALTTSRAQFDLMLTVEDQEDNLALAWEYNTDLFHAETIEQMGVQFNCLLESVIQTPEQPVLSLSLLTEMAASQVLTEWNNTDADFPDSSCIHQLFEQQVEQSPDTIAIRFEQQALTYQALNKRANQLAHYLMQLEVKPDQLVGICLERSIDMVVAILAVLKAGGAYVPLDPSYPADRLAYMLEDSQASVLIAHSNLVSKLSLSADQLLCVDDEQVQQQLAQQPVVNLDTQHMGVTATHLAYVIYTSGSTGKPKGVMNQHRGLVNRIHWMQKQFSLQASDNVLQKTPFGFDVSIWEYCWPLVTGASVVMARPEGHKDVDYLLDTIEQASITVMHFVPPMLATFIADGRYQHRTPSLRLVVCSGEALAVDVQNRFLANHHAELYNLYGPTEAAIDVSCWQCQSNFMGRSVPIGKPIDNTQLYVLDNQLKPVPIGVVGELFIGGVGLARGYFNREALTAERFLPDPFAKAGSGQESRIYQTGDLARWLPDGTIEYLGRIDHQVKLRGFRIELGEIETQLGNIPGVGSCVVIAREDQPGDKRLVAYIVPTAKTRVPTGQAKVPTVQINELDQGDAEWIAPLQQALAEQLPDYMVPVAWVVLDALPLTPNGKVDRKALPAPKQQTSTHYEAPQTRTEEVLAALWQLLLNTEEPVGRHAHFFALGGHSLLAIRLVAELRNQFKKELNVRSIFTHPTLASFAQFIDNALADENQAPPMTKADRQSQLPLSYAQQRLWFLAQLEGENSLYNMPLAIQLVGGLNVTALNQALNQLINRHESLRTCFTIEDGEAYQVIQAAPEAFTLTQVDLQQAGEALKAQQLAQLRLTEAERPFDVQQGLMIRGKLIILAPEKHVLLLTLHHIAGDAVSLDILMGELESLYQAYCLGEVDPLPTLPIQYADYAVWQRNWLQGEVLQKQLQYWQTQLADLPDVHSLPLDRPRPKEQSYAGDVYQQVVPTELAAAFRDFCQAQGVTLFMGLQAVFALLLSRYSGETDIVLGTPVANREQLEIEALIGFFVNTLVLRTDLSGNPSFTELLARCRETALDAYAHQQVPFEQLVEVLQPNRHLSHHPLFQVMLAVQAQDVAQQQLGDLVIEALAETSPTAKFDLTLNVLDNHTD